MTMIWLQAVTGHGYFPTECTDIPTYYNKLDVKRYCAVFGGFGGVYWFLATYIISILTSALGITKFLHNGPFAILSDNGALNGLLTWRFVLAYASVMVSLITKALLAAVLMVFATGHRRGGNLYDRSTMIMISNVSFLMINIFPNILMAIICIASTTGCSKKLADIIFNYPALLILPAFTHFKVGPKTLSFCGNSTNISQRHHLVVSKKCTIINMTLTLFFFGLVMVISHVVLGDAIFGKEASSSFEFFFGVIMPPIVFSSITLTLIFLALEKQFCCSGSQNYFFPCCCGPRCYNFRNEYINTATNNELHEGIKLQ